MKRQFISATAYLLAAALICGISGSVFRSLRRDDVIYPSEAVTQTQMLSDYLPELRDTVGDTEIYVIQGSEEGGSVLVLGGTHPNEPSGYLSAVMLVERAQVSKGTLYVIPQANRSAFTCNDPGDAAPLYLHLATPTGVRAFRYGSRATNPIDQWPDNDTYVHAASGQVLSGSEVRNLNRAYPGRADGNLTEKVAYAITTLIRSRGIDMTIDLHEASPEYPNINSTVAHENAMPIASYGLMALQMQGISIKLEPSPQNLHGLTHRELGDYTDTFALLMETCNACQGRIRGATDEHLALTGQDKCYEILVNYGLLYVPYDETGHPIEERVGRQLQGILEYSAAMSRLYPDKAVSLGNIPSFNDLASSTVGAYLH